MKIIVDSAKCTGHGRCYALAPNLFDADDQGNSLVTVPEVGAGTPEAELALRAVHNCPEGAIRLEES